MNPIHSNVLKKANTAAVFNLYLYLSDKIPSFEKKQLLYIVPKLQSTLENSTSTEWSDRDILRLRILKNAVDRDIEIAYSEIGNLTISKSGLTACTFTTPKGNVFIVFRGTGSGEWIDNGKGLSGIPEENTYITYDNNGIAESYNTVQKDYATDQQTEALNWFNKIAAKNRWNKDTDIIVTGHSKGGNKAQFVTVHSDLVNECFSFDGQGFSPEALTYFRTQYGAEFTKRRRKIRSFATDNDYVNVLGERLMPKTQIHFFESFMGLHYIEAMLDDYGSFRPRCEQGELSRYIENVSKKLMDIRPLFRRYATVGIMNIFQKYFSEGAPVNSDNVSLNETIVGLGIAIAPLLAPFVE